MLLLNYKPVLDQPTGIGVYANAVLPALQNFEHDIILGGGSGGGKERLRRFGWSQFQLPKLARERKADLIFTPAPEGYLGEQRVPQVVMVHDLRPFSHPERSMQSLYFKNWVPPLLQQCRHILTNSNFTATEICRSIHAQENKITAIPLGYDVNHFYPLEVKARPHSRPYLLHIGQAYPHKNLDRLIKSFNAIALRFAEVDLLLIGKPHPSETRRLRRLTHEMGLSSRVIFKSYVSYAELPNWYRGAIALVYPSLWEGFGLPILEAMACGRPVITSLGSGTEEIAASHARLVDPHSIDSLKSAMIDILERPPSHVETIAAANYAKEFSWKKTADKTRIVINNILNNSPFI